jgi:hypothetical protein
MVEDKVLRGRVARIIAATRFPFVDQEDWDESRRTIVNDYRTRAWALSTPRGDLYPSIVVLNGDGSIRECGEVEMESTFKPETVEKWAAMSRYTGTGERFKKFFLYVPEGSEKEAENLMDGAEIEYAGLRTWAIKGGSLVVKPIRTPDMAKDHR